MSAPIFNLTPPQSNDGDWTFGFQAQESDNGDPIYEGSPPADLVATIYVVDRDGKSVFSANSDDGTDRVLLLNDAYIDIIIPVSSMSQIPFGRYGVHLKYATLGRTMTRTIGYLPVTEGPQ